MTRVTCRRYLLLTSKSYLSAVLEQMYFATFSTGSRGLKVSVFVSEGELTCVCLFCSTSAVSYVSNGVWEYNLTMTAYTDRYRTQAVSSDTMLYLNQRVWFELRADGLDDKLVNLVTESCFATNEQSPESDLMYNLIINR